MRHLILAIATSIVLWGCAGIPVPDPSTQTAEMTDICPDGGELTGAFYGIDDSGLVLFKRGSLPVGLMDRGKQTVYVYAEKKTYTVEDVQKKYPSPCDLPPYIST